MVKHVVMWTLKDFAEGASKAENAETMKNRLKALGSEIDEVKDVEVGINLAASPEAYDIILQMEFESLEDIDRYLDHPAHRSVGDFVGKVRENRIWVDYEV